MSSGYEIVSMEITENERVTNGAGELMRRDWYVTVLLQVEGESPAAALADIESRLK